MSSYEARRLENIKRNESLVKSLGLQDELVTKPKKPATTGSRASKRRKLHSTPAQPTRVSSRIANASELRQNYAEQQQDIVPIPRRRGTRTSSRLKNTTTARKVYVSSPSSSLSPSSSSESEPEPDADAATLIASWTTWTSTAPPPTRDASGTYHFASHPSFLPNKSPESVLREGAFGGGYFRPLRPRASPFNGKVVIEGDWRDLLPASWTEGLSVERYLVSEEYDASVNKYGVACGQSIEEWEANGWIVHEFDVRGWFQWYCRFWLGRRCDDDERQIGRWRRCVGETGRWRRTLLKKYIKNGIRTVADEDDEVDETKAVSPVVHQTCHHWAWELRQEALDQFWHDET